MNGINANYSVIQKSDLSQHLLENKCNCICVRAGCSKSGHCKKNKVCKHRVSVRPSRECALSVASIEHREL